MENTEMQVTYRIVRAGLPVVEPADIIAWAEVNGHRIVGVTRSKVLREELQGQPIISGLLGPMYDGCHTDGERWPVIRYEDQAAYNILST
jgi:hypothetical protein